MVRFDQWVDSPGHDPYPTHREPHHQCDPAGVLAEDDTLEVQTGDCNYVNAVQPMLAAVAEGDWLELLMYHSSLVSPDGPGAAHFSLWVGDNSFWDHAIAIPAAGEVYAIQMQSTWSAPAEAPVTVHLHNHGANSWRVAYFRRLRGSAAPTGQPPFRGSDAPNAAR